MSKHFIQLPNQLCFLYCINQSIVIETCQVKNEVTPKILLLQSLSMFLDKMFTCFWDLTVTCKSVDHMRRNEQRKNKVFISIKRNLRKKQRQMLLLPSNRSLFCITHPHFMMCRFHIFITSFSPSLTSVKSSIICSKNKKKNVNKMRKR